MVSLQERSEQLTLRPYRCPHCSGILGNTTDVAVYLSAAKFEKTITFECMFCEKMVCWREPKDKKLKKS